MTNENVKKLSFDDQRELEYAQRAVTFLLKQRKAIAEELAMERSIIRKLIKQAKTESKTS